MNKEKPLISIVVPAYKDEDNIIPLYREVQNQLFSLKKYDFELILINDGSPDNTWYEIQEVCKSDSRVKGINLSRNFGHQGALTAGLEKAKGSAIISMDSDLQDPVIIAAQMIQKWQTGYEVIYARRKTRHDTFLKKYTAIWYYKMLSKISDTQIPRNVGDFRLVDKKVLKAFLSLKEKDRYLRGMFAWLGFKTAYIDFDRPERVHGESGYSLKKLLNLAMNGVLSFSMFPLRIGFIIGSIMILLTIVFIAYMTVGTIISGELDYYELYRWISAVGFGVMGLQFIFIWILGEYVGRIYNETRERPIYIVSDTINL